MPAAGVEGSAATDEEETAARRAFEAKFARFRDAKTAEMVLVRVCVHLWGAAGPRLLA